MEHIDTRVRYTKAVLKRALLNILREKPIAKVTIKEICEEAKINRGTFYLHYSEPNDLLMEIENDFIEENLEHFSPYIKNPANRDQLAGLFTCILKNREVSAILMGPHGAPQFMERIQGMMRGSILADWQTEFPAYDRADLEFVYEFILPGAMRLILNWTGEDDRLSPEELGWRLDRLGHYCHLAIREFHK